MGENRRDILKSIGASTVGLAAFASTASGQYVRPIGGGGGGDDGSGDDSDDDGYTVLETCYCLADLGNCPKSSDDGVRYDYYTVVKAEKVDTGDSVGWRYDNVDCQMEENCQYGWCSMPLTGGC